MKIFEKHKKLSILFLSFFIFLFSSFLIIKYELPKVVQLILKIAVGPSISSKKILFPKFGEIEILDLTLSNDGKVIIKAPKVFIYYSKESLKEFRLEKIDVDNPWINIVRKDDEVNIIEAFSNGKDSNDSDEKAGVGVPIDSIQVNNGTLVFNDITYSRPIVQEVYNLNGFVDFNKTTGINLKFEGNNKEEQYVFKFNNLNEPLNMNINLKNIEIDADLIQYGYDDKDISEATGIYNMDLIISTNGLFGEGELKNATLRYDELDTDIKDISGKINFKKDEIKVDFGFDIEEKKGKFIVNYNEKLGVDVEFKLKDIPYNLAAKYKLLGDLNLPLNEFTFKNADILLTYNQDKEFKVKIDYNLYPLEKNEMDLSNLNGTLEYKDDILTLEGQKINLEIKSLKYKKDLTYEAKIYLDEPNLKFNIKSNFINFDGEYLKKEEVLNIYQNSKLAMSYNFKDDILELLDLKGNGFLKDYDLFVKAKEEDKNINFESISMVNSDGNEVLLINGNLNREDLKYFFKIYTNDLKEDNILESYNLNLSFLGEIAGEKDKFILRGQVKDFKVENQDILIDTYADISVVKDEELQAKINGEIRKVKYDKYELQGIKTEVIYNKNVIDILTFRNKIFDIFGNVDIEEKKLNLDYKVFGLKSSQFEKTPIQIILDKASGEIEGEWESPIVVAKIEKAFLETPNREEVSLEGEVNFRDNKIKIDQFKINQSQASLEYDINTKNGEFIFNILEENLPKYYDYRALKYRLLARVKGEIKDGDIFTNAGITIDRVYYDGDRLPNLVSNLSYKKNNFEDTLIIDNITMLSLTGEKIINSFGNINLKEKNINFEVPRQNIKLSQFLGIINTNDMSGNIYIESDIKGNLENPNYKLKLSDGTYEIRGFKFNDMLLELSGNTNKLDIDNFLIYYENNLIRGEGSYNIDESEYKLNVFSKDIDLTFLNGVLPQEDIKNINGTANINVQLSNDLKENYGFIELTNFNADIPVALLTLRDFNMDLKVDNERLKVRNLTGLLNDGKIKGTGYLELPTIEDIKVDEEFYKNLDYSFNITLKNAIYELKDFFKLDISTDLIYSQNKVSGDIVINNGDIVGVLKEDKGLILMIVNFILDKTRAIIGESKKLGKEFEIKSKLDETPEFDVNVSVRDGIKINIPDISTFAQDVKGVLLGRFNIVGRNDDIYAIGDLEIQKGSFVLGNEDFTVTRALLLSDKRNGRITDFNPNLIFDISGLTANGNVEISLQGELNSLRLNIITNQGSESSSLKNLFDGEGTENERGIVALLFKTLIDSQISSTLLRPISKTIKDTFHISKFRIVSDVFNQQVLANSDDPRVQDPNVFGFGAYLEAENPIYKNEYFWVLKLGIIDGTKYDIGGTDSESQANEFSNSVNQFDFKVERRFPSGWSYGVGVSRLNDASVVAEKKKGKLNNYIDFKFERKYNSIKDIFSNK